MTLGWRVTQRDPGLQAGQGPRLVPRPCRPQGWDQALPPRCLKIPVPQTALPPSTLEPTVCLQVTAGRKARAPHSQEGQPHLAQGGRPSGSPGPRASWSLGPQALRLRAQAAQAEPHTSGGSWTPTRPSMDAHTAPCSRVPKNLGGVHQEAVAEVETPPASCWPSKRPQPRSGWGLSPPAPCLLCPLLPPPLDTSACSSWTPSPPWAGPPSTWTSKVRVSPTAGESH